MNYRHILLLTLFCPLMLLNPLAAQQQSTESSSDPVLETGQAAESPQLQQNNPEQVLVPVTSIDAKLLQVRRQLQQIQQSLQDKRNQIEQLRSRMAEETDNLERVDLQRQIDREETDLNNLRRSFENIALGGVDLSIFNPEQQAEQFDWQQELQLILKPLFQKMKDLTEKPRQIERLENQLTILDNQQRIAQRAINNVELLLDDNLDEETRLRITNIRQTWVRQLNDIQREREIIQLQLNVLVDDGDTILQQIRQSAKDFFTGSGLNLALAIGAFFTTLFLMKGLYLLYNRLNRQNGKATTTGRRMLVYGYQAFTIFISVLVALLVLYLVGDMLLMVIALIMLVILFLGLRNYLPQFINETRLLLDVGAVRERERVIYRDLPWRVRSLGVYSHLHNPALEGELRLPLSEMLGLVSRPYSENEPWFPSRTGDWVMMEDGAVGQILRQTPETVQLRTRGSIRNCTATDFMTSELRNLSSGFGISITFGIDYQLQPLSTTEVPRILYDAIEHGLKQSEQGKHVDNIVVDFQEAGASSLNYLIYVTMKGAAADAYFSLGRLIQRICVDTCNEQGWGIPFNQLTLHAGSGFDTSNPVVLASIKPI